MLSFPACIPAQPRAALLYPILFPAPAMAAKPVVISPLRPCRAWQASLSTDAAALPVPSFRGAAGTAAAEAGKQAALPPREQNFLGSHNHIILPLSPA